MIKSDIDWGFSREAFVETPEGRLWYGVVGNQGHADGSGKNTFSAIGNGTDTDFSAQLMRTPLLVIHGGPGMSHHYLYPLSDLARSRPVIFYDQLDAGLSDRPNRSANWTIERFIAEIDILRDELELDELSLFGNSWGGTVAAAYAASTSRSLESVVLSSPLISTSRWVADNSNYRSQLPTDLLTTMERCESTDSTDSDDYQKAVEVFYQRHFCRVNPWPPYLEETFEQLNETCYLGMWGPNEFTCSGVLKNYDGSADLERITARTMVTCGEFDEATPASCALFAGLIPGAEFLEFKNASHLAFIEVRESYLSAIENFLDKHK